MHEDTYRTGQEGEDEASLYADTRVWRGGKGASSSKRDKDQRDLETGFHSLRTELHEGLQRQSEFLVTQTRLRGEAVLKAVDALAERLDGVAQKLDLLLDALRDKGVRDAIDDGRATSDKHHRHLELAQKYQTLVRQDLLTLGRLLCPKQAEEDDMELARRRARAVAQLVEQLFQPLGEPLTKQPEDVLARLRELGHATDEAQFRGQFSAVFRKAADLRGTVADLSLTAELDFSVDVTDLPTGEYQVWNPSPPEGASPEFLVAPSYGVVGDRPQTYSAPFVFVAPAVGP
ncbi:hypothetical protein ABZZ79_29450 [Streptomyces sp. NPDC006458]|uniref:hypothetical protein n=1 Tax=Streptomyces sp. NPDC006458 TaxID=3154302 RepID=UPI0033A42AF8